MEVVWYPYERYESEKLKDQRDDRWISTGKRKHKKSSRIKTKRRKKKKKRKKKRRNENE